MNSLENPPALDDAAPTWVVAFDFDGTLAEATWPERSTGAAIPEAVDLLNRYYDAGYEIIIYTARPASHRPMIEAWLRGHALHLKVYDVICDKTRADLYIDDKAYRFVRRSNLGGDSAGVKSEQRMAAGVRDAGPVRRVSEGVL